MDAWQRGQLNEMERAAPNLVAYHKQTMQVTGELMGAGCAAPFLLARLLEAHNPKLRALARASFEVHDTSKTGTLSREESRTFFDDYVRIAVFINMTVTHHMLATDGGPALEALKPMMREQLQLLHQRTAPGHRPEGFDGKRRDEAAFGVLDKNGNGQLVEEEVVEALTLGTPQQNQLQLVLLRGPQRQRLHDLLLHQLPVPILVENPEGGLVPPLSVEALRPMARGGSLVQQLELLTHHGLQRLEGRAPVRCQHVVRDGHVDEDCDSHVVVEEGPALLPAERAGLAGVVHLERGPRQSSQLRVVRFQQAGQQEWCGAPSAHQLASDLHGLLVVGHEIGRGPFHFVQLPSLPSIQSDHSEGRRDQRR